MAVEEDTARELRDATGTASASNPLVIRLRQELSSCSKSVQGGDINAVSQLVNFIDSVLGSTLSGPVDEEAQNHALQFLYEIHQFLLSPSLDQDVVDALSFELPKAVSRFAGVSEECLETADRVIDRLIELSSPRDMISILCEALGSSPKMISVSCYAAPLLRGLSKVFLLISRRHFEQIKVAAPVIMNVLKAACSELDDGSSEDTKLFSRALDIADSMRGVCGKLQDGRVNEKLQALLGLYLLQIMALLSLNFGYEISSCVSLVSRLLHLFPSCQLSYLGLLTGSDVDVITDIVVEEDEDFISCLSYIKLAAPLSVIWGLASDEIAQAAGENISAVIDKLQTDQTARWQAVAMLKHVLVAVSLPWTLKRHAIDFLLSITSGSNAGNDEQADFFLYMPGLFVVLQALLKFIIYEPTASLRKDAFEALKRVLTDIPASQRFDMLRSLIMNSDSPSMIAILLDLVRGQLHAESCQIMPTKVDESAAAENQSHRNAIALELVEFVLRPPKGGPPSFPEDGDAVLAALNLYRFLILSESAGKIYAGALSKANLLKAYNEWLLPLRTLVTGIMTVNKDEHDPETVDTICALNPVELVLYRCIELVEEKMKDAL